LRKTTLVIITILIIVSLSLQSSHIKMTVVTVASPNPSPSCTYTFEFTKYPPLGWALVYTWAPATSYPASIGIDAEGLYVEDDSTTEDIQTIFTWALPHVNQSYIAEAWFKPSLSDITKDFSMRIIIGGTSNASMLFMAYYHRISATLKIGYYNTTGLSETTVAETPTTYTVSNNTWYRIRVNVTWTGNGMVVSTELRDSAGSQLLSLSNVELQDVYPVFGIGVHEGGGQTGRIYVKNATVTFYGEPNVRKIQPLLDPDYLTYDWVGAPFRVFFQHSDGKFYPYAENRTLYVTLRWHGEGSGTGDKIDLYKVVGDPRNPNNWIFVKTIINRTDLGWDLMEECNLIILNNGTWIGFVAGGTTYAVHKLISNDGGNTWTDKGTVINGKHNHIWINTNGTIFMAWWDQTNTTVHISKSNDLGNTWTKISQINGYSLASIYRYGDKYYVLAQKITETDNANYKRSELALFTSTDMVNFQFERIVYRGYDELPFSLYMNGLGCHELILYSTIKEDYLLVIGEWFVVDHDANDDFNDQNQRHLGILVDPIEVFTKAIIFSNKTLYLKHEISYTPNSTQFTHIFSATNTTTAGYETSYINPYGWRVYAEPFDSTENQATLVSEVNISLPYSQVLVRNITLKAKINGTGDYRRLWIKVLGKDGTVISELSNATLNTTWTTVILNVNTSMSNLLTLWINATINTTTTSGEEIGIKDVRVYIENSTNPDVVVPLEANVSYFLTVVHHTMSN